MQQNLTCALPLAFAFLITTITTAVATALYDRVHIWPRPIYVRALYMAAVVYGRALYDRVPYMAAPYITTAVATALDMTTALYDQLRLPYTTAAIYDHI